MTVHRFDDSLAYSHKQADEPWWEPVYREAFPDMVGMVDLRADGWHQKAGRDRAVILSSGRAVYVDEKIRKDTWPDIAVEVWSAYPKSGKAPYPDDPPGQPKDRAKKLGWARDVKDCDWLAYAFAPARTCHLIPFLGLRVAWEKNRIEWLHAAQTRRPGYRWIVSDNGSYNTISIAVPIPDLRQAIAEAMTISWAAAAGEGAA